jgi:hypothetical protein
MANIKEILEGKAALMSRLRDIVANIENEVTKGVLLTYQDGELAVNLLNVSELEATNMLMHAASIAAGSICGEVQ